MGFCTITITTGSTGAGFCKAWRGRYRLLCVMEGGILKSYRIGEMGNPQMAGELSFVQISDSQMGLNKLANSDVARTLNSAVQKIKGLSKAPESYCLPVT